MALKRNVDGANNTPSTSIEKYEEKQEKRMPNFFLCSRCGKEITDIKEFVSSQSELYAGLNYRLPICKNCMDELFNSYLDKYTDIYPNPEEQALKRICQLYDIYFDKKIYEKALGKINSSVTLIMAYIRIINLRQYKGNTYDTTLDIKRKSANVIKNANAPEVKDSKTIDEKTIKFFGAGLGDIDDYEYLHDEYNDWITRHECNTKSQEQIFKRIVIKQLEIRNASKSGLDTKTLDDSYIKYLETAKLQPKQNSTDTVSAAQTFGTLIDKWENTRPLPDIDEELQDVDKIGLYLDVFFRGHLAKMMGLKNALSNLYSKFIQKFTVTKPEYNEDDDAEVLFDAIFGNSDLTEITTTNDDDNLDFESGDSL